MKNEDARIAMLLRGLDGHQRTILIACCIRLLIEGSGYDSPLLNYYSGGQITKLIQELTTASLTDFSKVKSLEAALDLRSAERHQEEEIASTQGIADRLRSHDDGLLAEMNVPRAQAGGIIIRWLIYIRQNNLMSTEISTELSNWLFGEKGHRMQSYVRLREQLSI